MKQKFPSCFILILLFLIVFLISSSPIPAARLLSATQAAGGGEDAAIEIDSLNAIQNDFKMMEVQQENEEDCENGEEKEDCFKRRFLAEAHLDYIYTQQHKP